MRYSLAYLLTGDLKKYHKNLTKDLAKRFDEPYILDNPIPAHITLKYPFSTSKIKEIEILLTEFVKNNNSYPIKIKKIANFHKKVIVLHADFSNGAIKTHRRLMKELKQIKGLEWNKFDKEEKFHITLIYGNTPKNFKRIWDYATYLKPDFDIEFDNITILKKPRKYWRIYRIYRLK